MIYEHTKSIFSGQILEVYRFQNTPRISTKPRRPRKEKEAVGSDNVAPRRHDNIRRLRRGFLRLVQSNLAEHGAPSFVTLTFVSNIALDPALLCFREFTKRIREELGLGIRYIAVPEFQKRGSTHFHCLVWGIEEALVKNERYSRYLQSIWARGYLDIIPTDGSAKLAGYMAKYMQKALHDSRLLNRRAYYPSRNVMRPVLYPSALVAHYPEEMLGADLRLISEKVYQTEWLGEGSYSVYEVIPIPELDSLIQEDDTT